MALRTSSRKTRHLRPRKHVRKIRNATAGLSLLYVISKLVKHSTVEVARVLCTQAARDLHRTSLRDLQKASTLHARGRKLEALSADAFLDPAYSGDDERGAFLYHVVDAVVKKLGYRIHKLNRRQFRAAVLAGDRRLLVFGHLNKAWTGCSSFLDGHEGKEIDDYTPHAVAVIGPDIRCAKLDDEMANGTAFLAREHLQTRDNGKLISGAYLRRIYRCYAVTPKEERT
ncbi:hypothetical protein CYMTET_55087 [Cymbomonas tetramitiformis]|uniref:Uncharacterized protein n=1 Tax=Cymbomonas tetramitiformis TaxID=36881 RepID=A0AAE0BDF4_9CHLO|nr:hypothetical protein CYMTET_55087 [Cymbomonas tetramitiformis]|eukprot:gene332-604_t